MSKKSLLEFFEIKIQTPHISGILPDSYKIDDVESLHLTPHHGVIKDVSNPSEMQYHIYHTQQYAMVYIFAKNKWGKIKIQKQNLKWKNKLITTEER